MRRHNDSTRSQAVGEDVGMVHSEELFAHATASVQCQLTSERVVLEPVVEALKLERHHHVNETDCSPSSPRKTRHGMTKPAHTPHP